jgi:hypothetical protein
LDAFRGIFKRMQYVSGTEFYWGLPCDYFHHALLWRDQFFSGLREDSRRKSSCKVFTKD